MSSFCDIKLTINVKDTEFTTTLGERSQARFSPSSNLTNCKRETVSLTGSTFTALSPPTGAVALYIAFDKSPNDTVGALTLKGLTGDTGVAITPSTNSRKIPLIIPLGSTPSIGITNGGATQNLELIWL